MSIAADNMRLVLLCQVLGKEEERRASLQTRFSEAFAAVRKSRNISFRALATEIGYCAGYLCDIENDRRLPSAEVAAKIRTWAEGGK